MEAIYYLMKVAACSAILFGYYWLFLRNRAFHQWNRYYLLGTVVLSLLLPLVVFEWTFWAIDPDTTALLTTVQSADHYLEQIVVRSSGWQQEDWLQAVYMVVSLCLLAGMIGSLLRIRRLVRRHAVQQIGAVRFVNTQVKGTPFSFFRYVFWNEAIALDSPEGKRIFQHELVHVRAGHSWDKLLMQIVLVPFWCNPFFWLIRLELKHIHEFIADRRAAGSEGAPALAAMILQTVYPGRFSTLVNPFFQSTIKRRLLMLTKHANPKMSYLTRILVLPLLVAVAFAFSVRTGNDPQLPTKNQPQTLIAVQDTVPAYKGKEIIQVEVRKDQNDTTIRLVMKDRTVVNLTAAEARKEGLLPLRKEVSVLKVQDTSGRSFSGIYVVDGVIRNSAPEELPAASIRSVNVLKGESAVRKYGEQGRAGVIEITTKNKVVSDLDSANLHHERAIHPAKALVEQ